MSEYAQLTVLNGGIEARRQQEDLLRAGFSEALYIVTDITAVNAIVSSTRPDLRMTEPVPQRQITSYPFDHRRAGNFVARLGGFGDQHYKLMRPWPSAEPELTLAGRHPVTELGYQTYVDLFARGPREDYPDFAKTHDIDSEMALDAFDNSLTRYGAFARMALTAPDLTKRILRSCVRHPEQPKDLEIYIAYSLTSLLVDKNDREVKGPDDDQVLSR
jgi:hypothetical protein